MTVPRIEQYFHAERLESALFVLVGVAALALALVFLVRYKKPFFNGLSYALIAIALIQLAVGAGVYLRSPKDNQRVQGFVRNDVAKIRSLEIPRMETVMTNFAIYRWVEIALVLAGLFLFLYLPAGSLWKGLGLGLIVQAGLMLLLDFFAEHRGGEYLEFLRTIA